MSDKKDENKNCCSNCGDDRILLTEEMDAVPKCWGCGKARESTANTSKR